MLTSESSQLPSTKRLENENQAIDWKQKRPPSLSLAGMLEAFLREPTLLTDDDVMALLTFIFHCEAVQKKQSMLIENWKKAGNRTKA